MEGYEIVGGIMACGALGLSLTSGIGTIMSLVATAPEGRRATRGFAGKSGRGSRSATESKLVPSLVEEEEDDSLDGSQLRRTGIAGLLGDCIRNKDGSYTRAYHVKLEPSMLDEDYVVMDRYNRLGRMLASDKPIGTVIQFRLRTVTDRGSVIEEMFSDQEPETQPKARALHEANLSFHLGKAQGGRFRRTTMTMYVRVPKTHPNDYHMNGTVERLRALRHSFSKQSRTSLRGSLVNAAAECRAGTMRRFIRDELENFEEAEGIFRTIEGECPLVLGRMTRDELEKALYYSHSLDAESAPQFPAEDGVNLDAYLCNETVRGVNWYVMRGSRPEAMISMIVPPNPSANEGSLRRLLSNHNLNFNHTMCVEYVTLDKKKSTAKLDTIIKRTKRMSKSAMTGKEDYTPEGLRKLEELKKLRYQLTDAGEALMAMRVYFTVEGDPAYNDRELQESLKQLKRNREKLLGGVRELTGAEARMEQPRSLRVLHRRTILGEFDARETGRELNESSDSFAVMIPTESSWPGSEHGHTWLTSTTGTMLGLDLTDEKLSSPVVVALGTKGSGKSSLIAQFIVDILAKRRGASAHATDYGLSLQPFVRLLGGCHYRFIYENPMPLNVFDYPGLERGEMPRKQQYNLVVEDLKRLSGEAGADSYATDVLTIIVEAVYRAVVAHNEGADPSDPDYRKHEPVLSTVWHMLDNYEWDNADHARKAGQLQLALQKFLDDPWLDAPTHPAYQTRNRFTVYEIKDLESFPSAVRSSLSFRIAARITSAIGEMDENNQRHITVGAFDEIWRYAEKFPEILDGIKIGARTGRKEGFVTIVASHKYEDLQSLHAVTGTAGVRIIGKTSGSFDLVADEARLSPRARAAVRNIMNITGSHRQYVIAIELENETIVEMVQNETTPLMYWTQTNSLRERNARERVEQLRPGWSFEQVVLWLAKTYPNGLAQAGVREIDESQLPVV